MTLGPTVAMVAAGLAVVGGTSYVSLMRGDADSRAPVSQRVIDRASPGASINEFSAYLDATFASLRQTTRSASEATASIPRASTASTFAERFAGLMADVA